MDIKAHWENVYTTRPRERVGWYQAHAERSLRLIRLTGLAPAAAIIDVGAGASTLVEDLLRAGYTDLTALDLSATALATAAARLGEQAARVRWQAADVTTVGLPPERYDLWHDRALFHFLTHERARAAYRAALLRALKPGGWVLIATFAEDGPPQCSGLPVMRYGAAGLQAALGEPFQLQVTEREEHQTPGGTVQPYTYCLCRRVG